MKSFIYGGSFVMSEFENLKYRRQFLFSAKKNNKFNHWNVEETGAHFLYVHPDCEFSKIIKADKKLYLLGFAINPHFPEKTSQEILEDISDFNSMDDIFGSLYPLTGRFVLFILIKGRILIFNDACGLRHVHYTKFENQLYAASQPLLLQEVIPIKKSENYDIYYKSKIVKLDNEHFIPSGITLFDNIHHLVPNHYFDSADFKQKRYWPSSEISPLTLEEAIERASLILENSIYAAAKRYKLALALTAGWDSRVLLSASRQYIEDIFVFTLKYRKLTKKSKDIKVPLNLSKRLKIKHNLVNCHEDISSEFKEIYNSNSDFAHWDDWGIIANGMYVNYPHDRMAVRGHCVEIGRCDYYKLGVHTKIKSPKVFGMHYYSYDIDFIRKRVDEWYYDSSIINELGYDIYDFFYWEHEMGNWQAQSLLEWDIIHETFAPYNNRELLDITLSVDARLRCKPKYLFFEKLNNNMWSETMEEPVNPRSVFLKLKNSLKDILIFMGIKTDISGLKHFISKFT